MNIKEKIREIPDFPKEGILFRDITTLLKDPEAFSYVADELVKRYKDKDIDMIAGIESRGFLFGTILANRLGKGFVLIRKPGKLPAETVSAEYELEYGTDKIEMHVDALDNGKNVLLVDDLLATGGTMKAACELVERAGGRVVECSFLVELSDLKGKDRLKGYDTFSMVVYS